MKKFLFSTITILLLLVIVGCSSGNEENNEESSSDTNEKDQTIHFGVTPWTSTVPPTKVASLILQDMGYEVEETSADVASIFIGLSRGDLNVFMDAWMPTSQIHLDEYADTVEDTAVSYTDADFGVVVPTYMEDINTIEDLVGKEELFDHTLLGPEKGGNGPRKLNQMIEDYDLDMEQVNSSEGGMLAEARRLLEQEEPVIFNGWRPHTMFNKLDIKMLEDPIDSLGTSSVHVITNNDLEEMAPEAYEFISNWSIPLEDVEAMITEIDDGKDPEEAAQEWIDANQDKVDEMIGQ